MDCARSEYRQIAHANKYNLRDSWKPEGVDINYENEIYCAHCDKQIETAYGD
jgi:hypothetical protein